MCKVARRGVVDHERREMRRRRGGKCEVPEPAVGCFLAAGFLAEVALRDFCFADIDVFFFFFGGIPIFLPVTCNDHGKPLWVSQHQPEVERLVRRFCCWCKSRAQGALRCRCRALRPLRTVSSL